jgi:hypothetical protein
MKLTDDTIEKYDIYITTNGKYRSRVQKRTYTLLICEECGEDFLGIDEKRKFCTKKCSANNENVSLKRAKTNIIKYGCSEPLSNHDIREKAKDTKNIKYGDENFVNPQKALRTKIKKYGDFESITEKTKSTKLEIYDDEYYTNPNKRIETLIERYDVKDSFSIKGVSEKIKERLLDNYGVDNFFKSNLFIEQKKKLISEERNIRYQRIYKEFSDEKYTILTSIYEYILTGGLVIAKCPKGHIQEYYISNWNKGCRCGKCFGNVSKTEIEISDFVKSLDVHVISNDRTIISPLELDIVIPEKKIAIEYCGLYWHSEELGKSKGYHLHKLEKCKEKDYQLITVFENEWINTKDIVKSIIKTKLGKLDYKIHARQCVIKETSFAEKKIFLGDNHLQGDCVSKYNMGLYFKDELVSLLTIGKSRFDNKYDYEILRFCNKLNTSISGSFSKLFSHFKKNIGSGYIVTYSDRRYFDGMIYANNGFIFEKYTEPNYWYSKGYNLYNRMVFQKHKLKNKLSSYNDNLTEKENMEKDKYYRIWDCGNYKYSIVI